MEPGNILWEAVRTNDNETVNLVINPDRNKNNANEEDSKLSSSVLDYCQDGLCPVHLAILNGNIDILKSLLQAGVSKTKFSIADIKSHLSKSDDLLARLSATVKMSVLCLPLITNDPEALQELIKSDPSFNSDEKGEALGVACQLRNFSLLQILVDAGGSMYLDRCEAFERFRQHSLLFYAVEDPMRHDIVKLLLDRSVPPSAVDRSGNTPLHIAAKAGDLNIVKLFLDVLRTKRQPVCVVNLNTYSPLHMACHQGHLDVLKMLMQHKCVRRCHPGGRKYLLHSAAKAGHASIVDYLIQNGEGVNQLDNFANTPLSQAVVKANDVEISRLLLNAGADPNIPKPPYYSIIISAAQKSSLEMVTALLQKGADANSIDILGYSPISYVSGRRDSPEEFIHVLAEHGANIDHRHGDGSTSLHRAVADDNLPAVTSLIQHGADIASRNRIGKQPLHFAVSEEGARILLDKGAQIDFQDEIGYTPLMSACRHKNVVVARFLIDKGADINMTTVNGVSPLALAIGHDLTSLVRDLIIAGVGNINDKVFGHFMNMLELALCVEASPAICDILHASGTYIRPTFCQESLELCPQDYLNIPHCLGVYKPYVSLSLHGSSWSDFLKELGHKFDIDKYKSPLSLQGQCGQFIRKYFSSDYAKIQSLPLPETIKNGVLLLV